MLLLRSAGVLFVVVFVGAFAAVSAVLSILGGTSAGHVLPGLAMSIGAQVACAAAVVAFAAWRNFDSRIVAGIVAIVSVAGLEGAYVYVQSITSDGPKDHVFAMFGLVVVSVLAATTSGAFLVCYAMRYIFRIDVLFERQLN